MKTILAITLLLATLLTIAIDTASAQLTGGMSGSGAGGMGNSMGMDPAMLWMMMRGGNDWMMRWYRMQMMMSMFGGGGAGGAGGAGMNPLSLLMFGGGMGG